MAFPRSWRDRMEQTRQAGRALADRGLIEVMQKGRPVDPHSARGPIRYRLIERPPQ